MQYIRGGQKIIYVRGGIIISKLVNSYLQQFVMLNVPSFWPFALLVACLLTPPSFTVPLTDIPIFAVPHLQYK